MNDRYTGAIMLELAYGHRVTSSDDAWMACADEKIANIANASSVAAGVLDIFPFCKCSGHDSITD